MNAHTIELLRALRPGDAERVAEIFPAERRNQLREAIVDGTPELDAARRPRNEGHSRRAWGRSYVRPRPAVLAVLTVVAAGACAAVTLSGTSAVSPSPAEAVTFRTATSGDIVATVTEPFAAQARLDAAFASRGLEITVNLIPVSPSIVGTVLAVGESLGGGQIQPLQGGKCLTGGGGCPIGIEIPKDFTGEGSITLGRPAKAGEEYESAASIFAPGEPLHCSGLHGARVATALPVLQADGLTVVDWREDVPDPSGLSSRSVTDAQPPVRNYIWDAELIEPGKVRVSTASTAWPNDPGAGSGFDKGC